MKNFAVVVAMAALVLIFSAVVQAETKVLKIYASDNYSAGYQRAEAYGQEITDTIENIVVNDICWGDVATYNAVMAALPYFNIPSRIESEMRGMADALKNYYVPSLGRNVIYEDILMINITAELYSWREMYFCASAAAKGSLTQGGKVIATRSLDLENTFSVINMAGKGAVEYLYINGNDPIISIVPFPGIVGVVTGINPVDNTYFEINGGVGGVSLGNSPVPWLLLGRVILEDGGSMEGMIGLARNHKVACAFNPLIADEYNFAVMSGYSEGWYPRYPVWDMPAEVAGAISEMVSEDYIINVNMNLTNEMFYHDYSWYTFDEIVLLRDLYWNIHSYGIEIFSRDGFFNLENLHEVLGSANFSRGTNAITVDFNTRKILFSQAQPDGNGNVVGAWDSEVLELSFEQ